MFDLFTLIIGLSAIFFMIAVLFLLIKKTKPIREVVYLRERDRRGHRLTVSDETALSLTCPSKGGDRRFFKYGGSYNFHEGGRSVTRFFAKEGTAYTYKFQNPGRNSKKNNDGEVTKDIEVQCTNCGEVFSYPVTVPQGNGVKGMEVGSLSSVLQEIWGQEFYKEIPEEQKKVVEEEKIFVTVDMEPGLTPEGYQPISEDEIEEEQDRVAAKIFGRGLGPSTKSELYRGFLWVAVGIALTFVAFNLGLFH